MAATPIATGSGDSMLSSSPPARPPAATAEPDAAGNAAAAAAPEGIVAECFVGVGAACVRRVLLSERGVFTFVEDDDNALALLDLVGAANPGVDRMGDSVDRSDSTVVASGWTDACVSDDRRTSVSVVVVAPPEEPPLPWALAARVDMRLDD